MHSRIVAIFVALWLVGQTCADSGPAAVSRAGPLVRVLIPQDSDRAFGEAMVFARIVMGRTGIPFQVEHLPWDRALRIASTQPGVLITMISRTPQREAHFFWVGQLHRLEFHLYRDRERSDIEISNPPDFGRYRLGVVGVRDVISQYFLQRKMFTRGQLEVAGNDLINMRKLLSGRIDLMAVSSELVAHQCTSAGVDCSRMLPIMDLPEIDSNVYMAYSRATSESLVQRTRQAYVAAILDPSLSQIGKAALGAGLFQEKHQALAGKR